MPGLSYQPWKADKVESGECHSAADLAKALGANVADRSFQQAIAIMETCEPETQVAAILTSEISSDSFAYYAVRLGIPRAAKGGDRP
jgi:hypothetical protein